MGRSAVTRQAMHPGLGQPLQMVYTLRHSSHAATVMPFAHLPRDENDARFGVSGSHKIRARLTQDKQYKDSGLAVV